MIDRARAAALKQKVARGQRLPGLDDHFDQEIGAAVPCHVAPDVPAAGLRVEADADLAGRAAEIPAMVEGEGLVSRRVRVGVDQRKVDPVDAVLEVVDPVLGPVEAVRGAAILEDVGAGAAPQPVGAAWP